MGLSLGQEWSFATATTSKQRSHPDRERFPITCAALGLCLALGLLPFLAELPVYLAAAQHLAGGRQITDPFYAVGYPTLLAPAYALGGIKAVIALQGVLYVGTVWMFHHMLERACADARLVRLATALVALHPYLLLNIQRINDNAVNVLLILVLLTAVLEHGRAHGWRGWAAYGTAAGLLVTVRPNALPIAALPAVLLVLEARAWGKAGAFVAGGLAAVVAVSLAATGHALFVPENGPYNLFAGTNAFSAEALWQGYNGEPSIPPALAASGITGDPMGVPAQVYWQLAAGYAEAHPLATLELMLFKAANLFRPDWQFADDAFETFVQSVIALPVLAWAVAWMAVPSYRASRRGRLFLAFALLYLLPFAVINSDPRFRLPLDIALALETAIALGMSGWLARLLPRWSVRAPRFALHSRRA